MNAKQRIYFGPPLVVLTESEKNTMEISGRINRTAERYMAITHNHGVELSEPERECLRRICQAGYMSVEEIMDLPDEVDFARYKIDGLDNDALIAKLESASLADLVSVVEDLGY